MQGMTHYDWDVLSGVRGICRVSDPSSRTADFAPRLSFASQMRTGNPA